MKERRPLIHDGGRLLTFLVKRLSIPRESWTHTYFFDGNKTIIPTVKWKRRDYLMPHLDNLVEFINLNQPCVVVGMGKLCAEAMIGKSILKKAAGTYWDSKTVLKQKAKLYKVWISHTTDAALYNPELAVGITRIIWRAAMEAGIETKIDYSLTFPDFWYGYQ